MALENKLNRPAIERYARDFASKQVNTFFGRHQTADGQQLLDLTPIRQVNMFVLKALYDRWQQEAQKLRSPYFDYQHPEVKEGMQRFLNVLSQHIAVGRNDLEPLLVQATADTLVLALAPVVYFSEETERNARPVITVVRLKEISKYVELNNALIRQVIRELESDRKEVFAGEAVRFFHKARQENALRLADPNELLKAFSQVLGVQLADLTVDDGTSALPENRRPVVPPDAQRAEPSPTAAEMPAPEPAPERAPVPESSPAPVPATEADASAVAAPAKPTPPDNTPSKPQTLHEKLSKETPPADSLAERLQKQPIESIRQAIPIHQKFMFINELFQGDNVTWAVAVNELEESVSLEQAHQLLREKYAPRYAWNLEAAPATELMAIVERKFIR